MTLQELLKANGLTDEAIATIEAAMKENKIFTAGEENLDIRYGKLKTDHDTLTAQYAEAQTLIEDMKKSSKGNEVLQSKIAEYEAKFAAMQKELEETRLNAEVRVGLLAAKAFDIDYMTFKLMEKGELELDENGKIKGWDDKIAGLKTQFPAQFAGETARVVEPNRLPNPDNNDGALTRSDILKKPYAERQKLYNENPEAYEEAMKK